MLVPSMLSSLTGGTTHTAPSGEALDHRLHLLSPSGLNDSSSSSSTGCMQKQLHIPKMGHECDCTSTMLESPRGLSEPREAAQVHQDLYH
jgi:hypothetical protein